MILDAGAKYLNFSNIYGDYFLSCVIILFIRNHSRDFLYVIEAKFGRNLNVKKREIKVLKGEIQ